MASFGSLGDEVSLWHGFAYLGSIADDGISCYPHPITAVISYFFARVVAKPTYTKGS